ncbi:hypothetical protein BDQ17DRAFT_189948 [Cyathus striatus]|nr:hypothetical protein BDQ17DRAFT_189948 [Cyathus striatus]
MIHYQTSRRKANEKLMAVSMQSSSAPSLYSATSRAAQAQTRGLNNLLSLNVHERRRQATPLQNQQSPPAPTPLQRTPLLQELEEEEARNLAEDRRIAERELEQYEAAGLHNFHGHDTSENIVLFWELKESLYPLLSCVAMDALPAQASSVSCVGLHTVRIRHTAVSLWVVYGYG